MDLGPLAIRLALAGGAALGLAWHSRQNLALHKPVTASSVRFGAPERLVNGVVEWGTYGLWTHDQQGPWATIDLQGDYPIGEVRVIGRGDNFMSEQGAPVTVKLSTDGRTWKAAGDCPVLTIQVSRCTVAGGGAKARYVRVEHPSVLVLSEVEVYAAR